MIIDATDLLLGRLATFAAKKSLLGETVDIINCEKAVISGQKSQILERYLHRWHLGRNPFKGPFYQRQPEKFVKRTIRGMLPYKQPKGIAALKRVKCYLSVPVEFKDKKAETVKLANASRITKTKYVTVEEITKLMGARL